ncbi:TonB-dependent receptor [Aestuariicella hydrocarbonica]|uniref:TonB-dependent receptor n=1 Tax=Pseudomaricurvus hydrocarbonicus TaxID=1470433 RepID=A0A9E5MMY6_9GAMM|nr:TonB-dependent receptor [Aestuariicella hydrocarbonica]NHO67190.1 TonB-dependent receptor [Aestuariicella hydrocarbonica]
MIKSHRSITGATLTMSLLTLGVQASETQTPFAIEEVTVTAERREANLQDVPVAVSSFSQSDLQAQQVTTLGDLQAMVPNLSIHKGDANNAVAYIRGIGQIDSIAFFEPGVGIYLDDVYLGRAQGAFLDVIDVERIEVLRGPQGSLYGRNTVGGAIKYVSTSPTDEFSGKLSSTVGNYDRRDVKATFSGPLSETLKGQVTLASLQQEGYADNQFDGKGDGDSDSQYLRAVLAYDPTDNLSLDFSVDYSDGEPNRSRTPAKETPITITTVDPYTFGLSTQTFARDEDPFKVNVDFNRVEFTETKGASLNASWNINSDLNLKSISSYRELDYGTELDLDGTPINAFGIFYFNDQKQYSQEFQLSYQGEHLSAISGVYYYKEEGSTFDGGIFSNFLIAAAGEAEFSTESYAVFGQFDYAISDRLTATLGFRYTEEEKDYQRQTEDLNLTTLAGISFGSDGVSYANPALLSPSSKDLHLDGIGVARPLADPDGASFDNFSPKLGIKYQSSENAQIYANASTGFKSGGFNGRMADGQLEPFDEETLMSYEAGYKTQVWDDRVRLNAALFYNQYDDLQVSSFEASADGNSLLPVFSNAGEAIMQGVEIELTALVSERLTVTANVGYLDAEYKEFFAEADAVNNVAVDVSDERHMVNTPTWDAAIGLNYELANNGWGTFTMVADVSYRSKTYLEVNSSENLAQGGHSLINAALMFESNDEQWHVMLGGRNLSDKTYRQHAFDLSAFPGVELGYYGAPRTYSLSASYSF